MCRVSIIMGIYNCAQTLPEALDSILNQTYKDYEVIMCDDGSTDGTYDIAQKYVESHSNFLLIKNDKNLKLAATLNHCLEYADSEYIARMDGDDISLPERLEMLISFLDEHSEYSFVSSAMIHFDENGDWKITQKTEKPTKDSFKWGSPFCHAPVMMRKKDLNAIGNYTAEPKVERMEDYYLWHKFYMAGYKGYNLQTPLYKMRDDKNATERRRGIKANYIGYKTDLEILKDLGISCYWIVPTLRFVATSLIPHFMMHSIRKLKGKMIYHA